MVLENCGYSDQPAAQIFVPKDLSAVHSIPLAEIPAKASVYNASRSHRKPKADVRFASLCHSERSEESRPAAQGQLRESPS